MSDTTRDQLVARHRALVAEYATVITEMHALGACAPYVARDYERAYQTTGLDDLGMSIVALETEIETLRRAIATPERLAMYQAEYAQAAQPRCHYCGLPTRHGECGECGTVPGMLR